MDLRGDQSMRKIIENIDITPKVDCKTCHGSGVMRGDPVPTPFGPGYTPGPEEWCHCVIGQLPDDDTDDTYNIILKFSAPNPEPAEEWQIIIGGNFLHVWKAGHGLGLVNATYENGMVCEIEFPNVYERKINHDKAIAEVMPRAHLISRAPAMLRLLEKAYPIVENEAENRECAPHDGKNPCPYWLEMRLLADEIRAEIDRAHGREVAEPELLNPDDTTSPETCPHGFGFVEYCPNCKRDGVIDDDYDYAADDRNFDAARERSTKR